jgi:hypothetical protein
LINLFLPSQASNQEDCCLWWVFMAYRQFFSTCRFGRFLWLDADQQWWRCAGDLAGRLSQDALDAPPKLPARIDLRPPQRGDQAGLLAPRQPLQALGASAKVAHQQRYPAITALP